MRQVIQTVVFGAAMWLLGYAMAKAEISHDWQMYIRGATVVLVIAVIGQWTRTPSR